MKRITSLLSIIMVIGLSVSFLGVVGCEDDDDDDDDNASATRITPASATVPAGVSTSIVFSVLNGTPGYTWSVSDGSLGSVVSAGETVIYTSTTNSGQQVLTVIDTATNTATAVITQG